VVNSTRGVVTRSLPWSTHRGAVTRLSVEYRFAMRSDSGLLGLFIAIYATLAALAAWIVHMVRKTLRGNLYHRASPARTGAHR